MADFSQISSKIKGAAGSAAAATERAVKDASDAVKKAAEKNRLKREISSLESKLSADFREIGQMFYQENAAAPDEKYAVLFGAIADGQAMIAAKQEELAQVDNSIACSSCGKRISPDSAFCSQCGTPVPKEEKPAPEPAPAPVVVPATIVCARCSANIAADAVFCPECGFKVGGTEPEAVSAPVIIEEAAEVSSCPGCSATVQADAVFCPECGARINEAAEGIDLQKPGL
ncbi:MAG: zinc ribbon domain-containing protein [Ruminococcus sp.]|nr:zinc ribbon domain-containing protein [Ruminococcus sp.]